MKLVMNNLPPLGKATAAFDEDVDGDGEVDQDVGGVEAGDDQYVERDAHTPSPVTMLHFHIHTKHQEEIQNFQC